MKYVIISFFLFISINLFGQKKIELRFITNGVCEMCENRIEKSLLKLKGVWTVEWDVKTEETLVVYFPKKISETEIHQAISNVGHDQICDCEEKKILAPDKLYEKLHNCCKYRNEEIRKSHEMNG
jgi:copper chaperone CopZ